MTHTETERAEWWERVGLRVPARSVIDVLDGMARRHPDRPYLADHTGARHTYAEMSSAARRVASGLAELGVRRGDIVPLYMENSADVVVSMFALAYLGAAGTPVNTAYQGELLVYVLNDTGGSVAIVDDSLLDPFLAAAPSCERVSHPGVAVARAAPHGGARVPGMRTIAFSEVAACPALIDAVAARQGDVFMVNYTSGTTGPSKGILFPNGHVLVFAEDWVRCMAFTEDDVLYTPMPLFHTLGMILGMIATLIAGGSAYLDRRFSASRYFANAKECGATVGHAVFPMIPFLLNREPSPEDRNHAMDRIWTGPSVYAAEFKERFGVDIYEVYGISEAGVVSYPTDVTKVPPGSCGRPNTARFEIALVDEEDNPVPPGVVGEVIVRPHVPATSMVGYLGKPDKTADAFRNLWFHTGDRLYADEDGWLFFVDRAKDMIRRRSENISAYDIELVLNRYAPIAESAVIAVPSAFEDDEVKACLVMRDGVEFELDHFVQFCRSNLPKIMVPKYVEILTELPKTPNEKIAKYKLKEYGIGGPTGRTLDTDTEAIVEA
jgi:crotonobetaine/carnitine-CoA ligase